MKSWIVYDVLSKMSLTAGQILDEKYRIVRVLGIGGMGAVYEGENTRIHRRVAIKVLHAAVASKDDIIQRFEREAQAAGRIGSQHIVEVLDLGKLPGGERFMVMEFLDGEPLTQRIKVRGRIQPMELSPLLLQLLDGLGGAHHAGIIHRDLKPDNVFLVRRGGQDFVKLLDFGVSKFATVGEELSMTKTGAVMGTPYYMSPEQARGQPIDHRSDLYSVGVVAYQCLTGRVPFNAETFNELIFKIALETPERVENVVPGCDAGFASIVRKAMERDAAHRFQTAGDFARAIAHWQETASGVHPMVYVPGVSPSGPGVPQMPTVPGLSRSDPSLASNPSFHSSPSLHQSGLGQSGAGHSSPNLGGSNPNAAAAALGQSGAAAPPAPVIGPAMGQSQVGLAVTTGQSKKSAPVLIAIAAVAIVGAGGFALYKMKGSPAAAAPAKTSSATVTATATAAETTAPTAIATSPTTTPTSAAPTEDPQAETSDVPAESSVAQGSSKTASPTGPRVPTKPTSKPIETAATATATAKPTATGRVIDDKL